MEDLPARQVWWNQRVKSHNIPPNPMKNHHFPMFFLGRKPIKSHEKQPFFMFFLGKHPIKSYEKPPWLPLLSRGFPMSFSGARARRADHGKLRTSLGGEGGKTHGDSGCEIPLLVDDDRGLYYLVFQFFRIFWWHITYTSSRDFSETNEVCGCEIPLLMMSSWIILPYILGIMIIQ